MRSGRIASVEAIHVKTSSATDITDEKASMSGRRHLQQTQASWGDFIGSVS